MNITIDGQRLTLNEIETVAINNAPVNLSPDAIRRMDKARQVIDQILHTGKIVYGVNTGFGKLSDVRIPPEELLELQLNLVRSHACGVGQPLSEPETRAMMLLRANVLACGFSGARPLLAQTLIELLNKQVHPIIPEKGSVGASGDLAPLAHLALVLIGEGEAIYKTHRLPGAEALKRASITPVQLQAKEGLALLNGTQAIGAVGGLALTRALRLVKLADVAGAMTLDALRDTPTAFDERIQKARPYQGQIDSAKHLLELMKESEIRESHRDNDTRVQDAYSLRCMPQVHGAVRTALEHAREILEIESGSATDNPLVFVDTNEVVSGGNFHGAPLAYVLDYAAIALTDLGSICERRIERLVNPDLSEGLPAFLTSHAGTCSGFMMAQVTAAALLNECKILSYPASVDNIPTSGGKEDHVSMGMNAALKFRTIVDNVERLLAIELMAAAEGLEYRKPLKPGKGAQQAFDILRSRISQLDKDRPIGPDIECLASMIRNREFDTI